MTQQRQWILPFSSELADLETVGGKAANLSRMIRAGLPVPPGFFITTDAYRRFVEAKQLEEEIIHLLPCGQTPHLETLEDASRQIRRMFSRGEMPGFLADALLEVRRCMNVPAVAVRSSATAEDLPDMSFAGQQDTFLNVVGDEQFLKAVIDCWSSLWTARAIGYRMRNRIPNIDIGLGVVVQQMVESQASGVLFTANPVSGLRSETVIDAALGLGEAVVSGRVEPDHYVVDTRHNCILKKTLGKKELSIHGQTAGYTQEHREDRSSIQALPDEHILQLAILGEQAALFFGFPQDIEWALAENKLFLLQSRPITSLYPLPEAMPAEPLKVMFSFAAVQGMMDPVTPIGQDALCRLAAAVANIFDRRISPQSQSVFLVAGERLWVNITSPIRNAIGRKVLPGIFDQVEPTVRQAVLQLWNDPRLQPGRSIISPRAAFQMLRFFLPLVFNLLQNLASPQKRRQYIVDEGEAILRQLERDSLDVSGNRWEKLEQRASLFPQLLKKDLPKAFLLFVSGVASGMASWNLLKKLAERMNGKHPEMKTTVSDLVLQATRSMPNNPTVEMDLSLWEMSKAIRHDQASLECFHQNTSSALAANFLSRELPEPLLQAIDQFLARYGGRGFCEIDLGHKRWASDPTHVFEMLTSFLQIEDESKAPDVIFASGADSAQSAIHRLVEMSHRGPLGLIKGNLISFFAGRMRQLMGLRESPKFFMVRMMWIIQRELLKSGAEFSLSGEFDQPEDILFFSFDELEELARGVSKKWRRLAADRRAAYEREQQRRQIPRLLLSDGRTFYQGITSAETDENNLHGSPVSPGSIKGRVRVVLDPRRANLQPGDILVCPGTDPSWTPLFLSAGGLVMETGGMMTHGAVVAREYGIPAVVGVDRATQRLQTGEWVHLDGSSGLIVRLKA